MRGVLRSVARPAATRRSPTPAVDFFCPVCCPTSSSPPRASTSRLPLSHSRPRLVEPWRTSSRSFLTEAALKQPLVVPVEEHDGDEGISEARGSGLLLETLIGDYALSRGPKKPPTADELSPKLVSLDALRPRNLDPDGNPSVAPRDIVHRVLYGRPPTDRFKIDAVHLQLYAKAYEETFKLVDGAFTKSQLLVFAGPGGMAIDVHDKRLREGLRGKKKRRWFPTKSLKQLSKAEVIKCCMLVKWGMMDPQVLSALATNAVHEFVPVSEKQLFLLLTPRSPFVTNLFQRINVSVTVEQDPSVSGRTIKLHGSKIDIDEAKIDIDQHLVQDSAQSLIELPKPTTALVPEVYQTISGLSKVYLEPAPNQPTTFLATATKSDHINNARWLLAKAFVHNSIQSRTPLFLSTPLGENHLRYSMFPFAPATPPSWTQGSTSHYARVRAISRTSSTFLDDPTRGVLHTFGTQRLLGGTSQVALVNPDATVHEGLAESLLNPFLGREGVELSMEATFGNVLWPLYRLGNTMTLGPVLEGDWTADKFRATQEAPRHVFIPAIPPGFLASTGVLVPISSQESQIQSIFSSWSDTPSPPPPSVASVPAIDSESFRRLVYLSLEPGSAVTSIRVEYRDGGAVIRQRIERRTVNLMLPYASCDVKVTLSAISELDTSSLPERHEFFSPRLPVPRGATSAHPSEKPPPTFLTLDGARFVLDSDSLVHAVSVAPVTGVTQRQERVQDNLFDGSRGASVSVPLGKASALATKDWKAIWKRGLEVLEKTAMVRYSASAAGVDVSASHLMFKRA